MCELTHFLSKVRVGLPEPISHKKLLHTYFPSALVLIVLSVTNSAKVGKLLWCIISSFGAGKEQVTSGVEACGKENKAS